MIKSIIVKSNLVLIKSVSLFAGRAKTKKRGGGTHVDMIKIKVHTYIKLQASINVIKSITIFKHFFKNVP